MKKIPINIWDDYYDDGYVPSDEIQETYIYVEDHKMPLDERKKHLEDFLEIIKDMVDKDVKLWIELYDSKLKYPNLIGPEYETMHFKRWEIKVQHLTHENREKLVKKLKNMDTPYNVYSES